MIDTVLMVLVLVAWMAAWNTFEKHWKNGKRTISLVLYSGYTVVIYLIGYSLTTLI